MGRLAIVLPVLAMMFWAPPASADISVVSPDPIKVDTAGHLFKLNLAITNVEPFAASLRVQKAEALPDTSWKVSICLNGACIWWGFDTFDWTLPAGETDTLAAWIEAREGEGSGSAFFTIGQVFGFPNGAVVETLTAITDGMDVLVVDDDGLATYDTYYTGALPGGLIHGRWPRHLEGPTAADLLTFPKVIWLTGSKSPSLDAGDRSAISSFLSGGGKLFLSGQNIAYSLCDPGSPEYSTAACNFVNSVLHASYLANNSGTTNVVGDTKDPIGDGLSFSINGGAGNQSSPDGISPASGGNESLIYDGTAYSAGVHYNSGGTRLVFFSFGFEGISDAGTRSTIMQRIFNYMDATVGVASAEGEVPPSFALAPNQPNPFNPETRFTLHVDREERASLVIFDLGGRVVRTIWEGVLPSGESSFTWDGRDDKGVPVPSGVYFARLAAGERMETRKVTLLR